MGTIVVGYDGTPGAQAALDEAATLAAQLGDGLELVFSYEAPRAGGEVADLDAAIQQRADAVLAEGGARASSAGVPMETRKLDRPPADGLIATAEELGARMIVVGSTGESPLKGVLLGSTSYRLVHLSTHPVLVVRAPD